MKTLLPLTALLEAGAGLALLSLPSLTATYLLGAPLESPAALTAARVGGAGLLALGVACWLARGDSLSPAAKGLVGALLIYNVAATAVLTHAGFRLGLHGILLWPAALLHAAMAVWCTAGLRRSQSA